VYEHIKCETSTSPAPFRKEIFRCRTNM